MIAFILQFGECIGAEKSLISVGSAVKFGKDTLAALAGTKTLTEVRREEVDNDPQHNSMLAIPNANGPQTGTTTITAVRAEQVDADPDPRSLRALPK